MEYITINISSLSERVAKNLLSYMASTNPKHSIQTVDATTFNVVNNFESAMALAHFIKSYYTSPQFIADNTTGLQAIAIHWQEFSAPLRQALYARQIPQLTALLIINGIDPVADVEYIRRTWGE